MRQHLLTFALVGLVVGLFISAIWLTHQLASTPKQIVKTAFAQGVTYKRTYIVETQPLPTMMPSVTPFPSPTLDLPTTTLLPTVTADRIIVLPRTGSTAQYLLITALSLIALAFVF